MTNIDNLERLLAELFNQILTDLLAGLENIEFEMPELLGLSLTLPDMAVYGQDNLGISSFYNNRRAGTRAD
jgi:hypothetical protein